MSSQAQQVAESAGTASTFSVPDAPSFEHAMLIFDNGRKAEDAATVKEIQDDAVARMQTISTDTTQSGWERLASSRALMRILASKLNFVGVRAAYGNAVSVVDDMVNQAMVDDAQDVVMYLIGFRHRLEQTKRKCEDKEGGYTKNQLIEDHGSEAPVIAAEGLMGLHQAAAEAKGRAADAAKAAAAETLIAFSGETRDHAAAEQEEDRHLRARFTIFEGEIDLGTLEQLRAWSLRWTDAMDGLNDDEVKAYLRRKRELVQQQEQAEWFHKRRLEHLAGANHSLVKLSTQRHSMYHAIDEWLQDWIVAEEGIAA